MIPQSPLWLRTLVEFLDGEWHDIHLDEWVTV